MYNETSDLLNGSNVSEHCPNNLSTTLFGHSFKVPRDPETYILIALCHIVFILIPCAMLSPITMYFFVKKTLSKHPTNLIFCWIAFICFIGPCGYGLLMDLSLIFDVSLLGRCEQPYEGTLPWIIHTSILFSYQSLYSFIAIMFYVSIRFNIQSFSKFKLNLVLAVIVTVSVVFVSLLWLTAEDVNSVKCKIRGSFCVTTFSEGRERAALLNEVIRASAGTLLPTTSVAISLVMYYRIVRANVVRFDGNLMKSMLKLVIVLSAGCILWIIPNVIIHFGSFYQPKRSFIELITTFSFQLNYLSCLLFSLTLHKELRSQIKCCRVQNPILENKLTSLTLENNFTSLPLQNDFTLTNTSQL